MARRLPQEVDHTDQVRPMQLPNGIESHATQYSDSIFGNLRTEELPKKNCAEREISEVNQSSTDLSDHVVACSTNLENNSNFQQNGCGETRATIIRPDDLDNSKPDSNQIEAEWIEQFEPGVYITLIALRDGTRELKRVRFR